MRLVLEVPVFSKTGAIARPRPRDYPSKLAATRIMIIAMPGSGTPPIPSRHCCAPALEEPIAAFDWLVRTLGNDGQRPQVVYTLDGAEVPDERIIDVPGYKGSRPVRTGNRAKGRFN